MAGADALISADSHVVPLPTFWREYLPARFRDRAPVVETTDEGEVSVFEGRRSPVMAINSIAGKSRDGLGFTYRRFADQVAGGHDPAARIVDQERDGVVAEVLYGGGPLATSDPGSAPDGEPQFATVNGTIEAFLGAPDAQTGGSGRG